MNAATHLTQIYKTACPSYLEDCDDSVVLLVSALNLEPLIGEKTFDVLPFGKQCSELNLDDMN